jgi:chitodextrinase
MEASTMPAAAACQVRRFLTTLAVFACALAFTGAAAAASATKISLSPAPLTLTSAGSSTLTAAWKQVSAGSGYDVYLNRRLVQTTTSTSHSFSGLSCGKSYKLGVDAFNNKGQRSSIVSVIASTTSCSSATTDAIPPSTPGSLTAGGSTSSTVTLQWSASSDNVAVTGYDLYLDGRKLTTTTGGGYTFAGLSCGASYTLDVDAFDAAGNRSPRATATASTTPCPDVTPPSSASQLTVIPWGGAALSASWSAAVDNVGVAGYGIYVNGVRIDTTPWTTYLLSGLNCGSNYTVSVRAFDVQGNLSQQSSVAAATAACPVADTQPPSAPSGAAAGQVTATGFSLSWNASTDNVATTGYGVYLNGALIATTSSRSYAFTGLSCGTSYAVAVDSFDASGNRSPLTSQSVSTLACATPAPSLVACDRVASPTGSDANAGTATAPFATPQKLADSLTAGQTGCLRAGTYTASSTYILNISHGGTASSPLTIRSYQGEQATLVGIVQVRSGADRVVLASLAIQGDGSQNSIQIYGADDAVVDSDITNKWLGRSCVMLGSNAGAGQAVRTTVRGNRFHECGNPANGSLDHGVYAANLTGGQITDNVFWDSAAYAIQLYPNAQNTLFAHNVIDGGSPSVRGGVIFGGDASYASSNNTVEDNVIAYGQASDISSWWGGSIGNGNLARSNCLWAGVGGDISLAGGGFSVSGNLSAEPAFVDRSAHDYRLQPGSPCLAVVGYDAAAKLASP